MRGVAGVASGKILYFVRPETKRPRAEHDVQRLAEMARKAQDDSRVRQQFNDLLKGIWPDCSGSTH